MKRLMLAALAILALALLIAHVGASLVLAKPTAKPTPKPRADDPGKPDAPDTPMPDKPTAPATPEPQRHKPTATLTPTPVPPTDTPPTTTPTHTCTPTPTGTPTPTPTPELLRVSGRVFDDRDGDGQQGSGEEGVSGVPITVDGAVVAATDDTGYFQVSVPAGRTRLAIVPPAGWGWQGLALAADELASEGALTIAVHRLEPASTAPGATTAVTGTVMLVALAAGMSFFGVAGLMQTAAIRRLAHTYRRQKSLELEQLQARAIDARRREVVHLLDEDEDGWCRVVDQLLADALPGGAERVSGQGLVDISMMPVPRFTVAGPRDLTYLFTTSPQALREVGILSRKHKPIALDAALHPAARVEVQAVWDHLAARRLAGERAGALARQAAWFLVVRPVGRSGRG